MKATTDQEITHDVTDAQTQEVQQFLIQCDYHGMTVELPNGHIITLDLSGGVVSVYHTDDSDSDLGAALDCGDGRKHQHLQSPEDKPVIENALLISIPLTPEG